MLGFLFVDEADFTRDATSSTTPAARSCARRTTRWPALETWRTADDRGGAARGAGRGAGLKPRIAFGPVRIAVTGRKVSPPLFESLELLGRERSLARLRAAMTA